MLGILIVFTEVVLPMVGRGGFSGNAVPILSALAAGAVASVATGFFARPKTKAEADQANSVASVSLSADAREWAQLWMRRSEDAQAEAHRANERAELAEQAAREAREEVHEERERREELEELVTGYMAWTRQISDQVESLGGTKIPPPPVVLDWLRSRGEA